MLQSFTTAAIAVAASLVLAHPSEAAKTKLFHGGTIIAWDMAKEEPRVIRGGSLLIEGDRIKSILDPAQPEPGIAMPKDAEKVDCTDKIITPGFIDTHRHGWQTVFKTLGSNTTLVEYMGRYRDEPASSTLTTDDLYISQLMGLYEALNAGVTTMLDHAHHTWTPDMSEAGLRACVDSGARVFWAYTFHGHDPGFTISDQVKDWHSLRKRDDLAKSPSEVAIAYDEWSLDPHGEGTKQIIDLMSTSPSPVVTAHSIGGLWGDVNQPELLHSLGVLSQPSPFILSHAVFVSPVGANILRTTDQHISITPESEMAYGHLHPDSHRVQDQASLGVDTHFTFSTDILTQARIWLQKTRYDLYAAGMLGARGGNGDGGWRTPGTNPMSANQAFALATRKGGLALRKGGELGVLVEGAKADLLVWDGRAPSMLGWADPVAAVMLHANVGDIEDVLVGGDFRKRKGEMVTGGDETYEGLKTRFLVAAKKMQDKMREVEAFPMMEKWWSGVPVGEIPGADVVRGEGTGYGPLFWGGEGEGKGEKKVGAGGKDEL